MDMFVLGFVCGNVSFIIGAAVGWLAHRELVYRPAMREANREACEAIREAREAIAAAREKQDAAQ